MLQYITSLIDSYSYKPSPNEINDKFDITNHGLIDKRTSMTSYNWRGHEFYMPNIIFHNSNDGLSKSLGILLPLRISFFGYNKPV